MNNVKINRWTTRGYVCCGANALCLMYTVNVLQSTGVKICNFNEKQKLVQIGWVWVCFVQNCKTFFSSVYVSKKILKCFPHMRTFISVAPSICHPTNYPFDVIFITTSNFANLYPVVLNIQIQIFALAVSCWFCIHVQVVAVSASRSKS